MSETIKKLQEFIKYNAFQRIVERGTNIYNSKYKIESEKVDLQNAKAKYLILGSEYYEVEIKHFFNNPKTKCSCPYDWGGLCKHEVASILKLIEYLQKNYNEVLKYEPISPITPPKKKSKARLSTQPFLLKNSFPVTSKTIAINSTEKELQKAQYIDKVYNKKITGKIATFEVIELSHYWTNRDVPPYSVYFSFLDGGIQTTCTCNKSVIKTCRHQIATLEFILNNYNPNYFELLKPNYLKNKKKKLSKETGIPLSKIDKYFDFNIKQCDFIPKGEAEGLIDFRHKTYKEEQLTFLEKIKKKDKFSIIEPFFKGENELFILGYVFQFSHDNDKFGELKIFPVSGKKANNNELKYLKEYFHDTDIPIDYDENDEKVLSLLSEMQTGTKNINVSSRPDNKALNSSKKIYRKLQKLFSLLSNRKYIYKRTSAYNYRQVRKMELLPVSISEEKVVLFFELSKNDIFYKLQAKLRIENEEIDLSNPEIKLNEIFSHFAIVQYNNTFYLHQSLNQIHTVFNLVLENPQYKCLEKDFNQFFHDIITPLSENYEVRYNSLLNFENKNIILKPDRRQLYLSELANFIIFKPFISYDHEKMFNICSDKKIIEKKDNAIIQYERDNDYEQKFLEFFIDLHPKFEKQTTDDFFFLSIADLMKDNWFFNFFEKLTEEKIEIFGTNDLKSFKYSPFKATISSHLRSGEDWFDVQLKLSFGEETVKLSDLRSAVLNKNKYIKLSDGKYGILPEKWFEKLERYFRAGEIKGDEIKISKLKFSIIDDLFENIDDEKIIKELAEKRLKLKKFDSIKNIKIPKEITANLRDYQKSGVNWLNFLNEFQWGGILADDMGLGKTIQVLTIIQKQVKKSKKPNFAVVPTTLLFNWENEIKKFAPDLTYLIHHGVDRTTDTKKFKRYNLIITTYGTMLRDIELLQDINFNYIILDESQAIKNPISKRYKAACLLKGQNKIAMTGTPIENNTFDLYAQMSFLNPGFFGGQKFFKDHYSKPIDGEGNSKRAEELQKMINPFILRRTKGKVAKELPPKIEDYIYVTMEEEQRKVYDAFRNKYRNYLLKKFEEDGFEKSKMYVLEGLMKLRQICDSPELLPGEDYGNESAKIKELINHITEKTGNHKILVFSQFVKMLRIIERELKTHGIKYEYLDGQCTKKQREKSVNNFQEIDEIRVFLISLKAGGTGLNLTAADYVYIVDPWWNPAVETQAIDRTHRIGQDKHVIAYRMIAKNTVEEKIINYQKRKLKIASDIIKTDTGLLKNLTQSDIRELFE